MKDATGADIVCNICTKPLDINNKYDVRHYPPFIYVHRSCEFGEALADIATSTNRAGFLQVIPGSETCINGHRIVFMTNDGTPWLCDYDLCEFYYGKSKYALKNSCQHEWEIVEQNPTHVTLKCDNCNLKWSIG